MKLDDDNNKHTHAIYVLLHPLGEIMNLVTLATLIATSYTASITTAQDSKLVLKAIDNNIETQSCIVAASKGLDKAKDLIETNGFNFYSFKKSLSCNGMSLSAFAEQFEENRLANLRSNQSETVSTYKVIATNQNKESQLCVDALAIGEDAARKKHGLLTESILCNQQPLRWFVKDFENKNLAIEEALISASE